MADTLKCNICHVTLVLRTCCTNTRCLKCHGAFCTPGGSRDDGHKMLWPKGHHYYREPMAQP
jgi:hypothetical protein